MPTNAPTSSAPRGHTRGPRLGPPRRSTALGTHKLSAALRAAAAGVAAAGALAAGGDSQAQELRVGAGYSPHSPEQGGSVMAEFLFKPLRPLARIGSPRPYVSAQYSLDDYTNFAQAGLIWRFEGKRTYLDLGGGLAVHDGHLTLPRPQAGLSNAENQRRRDELEDRLEWESRAIFHATFAIGWRVNSRWALEFEGQHWSNGQLGNDTHDGANSLGLRTSYSF